MNTGDLLQAWYDMLNTHISVPVYKYDVPELENGNYVIIRIESGTGANNKRSLNDTVVVITDIVTRFNNNVDSSVAESIDAAIFSLALPTSRGGGLVNPSGMQILNVNRENFDYIEENDGTNVYLRKMSRYSQRIHSTV